MAVASAALLAALAAGRPARAADAFEKCISAYEQAQIDRKGGKLLEAKANLLVCSQPACPSAARKDCSAWLGEVEAAIPTAVIEARDGQGADVVDVRVLVDGRPVATRLDGKAIPLNPDIHIFRYERDGAPAVEQKVTIRQGEKNRKLLVSFLPTRTEEGSRPIPPLAFVLGGVGLLGLGGFAFFGIQSKQDESELAKSGCAPHCAVDKVDAIATKHVIADVSLGVGVASIVAATVVFLMRPSTQRRPAATSERHLRPVISRSYWGVAMMF